MGNIIKKKKHNATEIMKEIEKGRFIREKGEHDNLPIHFAAENGRKDVAEKLLDLDMSLANIKNSHGQTPLFVAVKNGKESMVKYLLEREKTSEIKNVNEKNDSGDAPLHMAAEKGFANIAKLLLAYGAKIEEKNAGSFTPLHLAATCGKTNVMKILLGHKPTPANAKTVIDKSYANCGEFIKGVRELLEC